MKAWTCGLGLAAAVTAAGAEVKPLHKLDGVELDARLKGDVRTVQLHREGLRTVIRFVEARPDLFPASPLKPSQLLPREKKEEVWSCWQRFLDYMMALDSLARYHASFHRLKGAAEEESFLVGQAALLAQYRSALELIERAENNAELDKILNEPVPEIGLPKGTYAKLKFQFLNVALATEFAARQLLLKTYSGGRQPALREIIQTDADRIWQAGKGKGEVLTAKNAWKIVRDAGQSAWFPVQAGVSEWMGDTQVYRAGRALISADQIQQLFPRLEPGDVLLERREWFLSNIGLPGFWSHAALYIGTTEERHAFFSDPDSRAWVTEQGTSEGDFEALLRARYPDHYERSLVPQEENHRARVLEAISEGVSFTTLEHSAACDSLAVLRPRLPKPDKARAILRAFHYAGRPYDFDFDFATDAELVCSEVIYKAYEPAAGFPGLRLPVLTVLGRQVTPPNEFVRQFDAQFEAGQAQFELILFLDGQERRKRSVEASLAEFRESWKRPKWHLLVQGN